MSELETVARPFYEDSRLFFYDEGYQRYLDRVRDSVLDHPSDPKEQGRLMMFNELMTYYYGCHMTNEGNDVPEEEGIVYFHPRLFAQRLGMYETELSTKFDILSLGKKAILKDFSEGFWAYYFRFSPINDPLYDEGKKTAKPIGMQRVAVDLQEEMFRQEAEHKKKKEEKNK